MKRLFHFWNFARDMTPKKKQVIHSNTNTLTAVFFSRFIITVVVNLSSLLSHPRSNQIPDFSLASCNWQFETSLSFLPTRKWGETSSRPQKYPFLSNNSFSSHTWWSPAVAILFVVLRRGEHEVTSFFWFILRMLLPRAECLEYVLFRLFLFRNKVNQTFPKMQFCIGREHITWRRQSCKTSWANKTH